MNYLHMKTLIKFSGNATTHRPQASAYSIWQTNTHVHIKKASKNNIKSTAVARNVYTMCTPLE